MDNHNFKVSVVLIAIGFFCGFFAIGYKLCFEHLKIPDSSVGEQRNYHVVIPSLRGSIFDCNNRYMAMSHFDREYFIDPHEDVVRLEHRTNICALVSNVAELFELDEKDVWNKYMSLSRSEYETLLLNRDPDSCWRQYRAHNRYNFLRKSNSTEIFSAVTNKSVVSGIAFRDTVDRDYPEGRGMSHVIGYIGYTDKERHKKTGCAGVELQFNELLTGSDGVIEGKADATRHRVPGRESFLAPAVPGHDVYLTLDSHIQHIAEKYLKECVVKFQAEGGCVLVEQVKTGKILAMASFPDFSPEHPGNVPLECFRNRTIQTHYEPGSVMKPVMACIALQTGVINENTRIDVGNNRVWFFANRPLRDHVTGYVNLEKALVKSSNIFFGKLGLMLGNKRMYQYLKGFNFDNRLGIKLPYENPGQLDSDYDKWSEIRTTRVPIGQGIAVSALQLANAFACIANDGRLMKPAVLDRIVDHKGNIIRKTEPRVIGSPVSKDVARKVRYLMTGVTRKGGTGRRGAVKGYTVAGKTGTAQKIVDGAYSQTDFYATFVGMIPAVKPEIVILVTIDTPKPQHTGGYVAAPAFSKIGRETTRYLLIPPDDEIVEDENVF
ncbi:MAG: penicillin-binding protein 2 [Kiritimatiellia bacterium]